MVKREQGFKKKRWHGSCYHQLLSAGQLCPQCPSFCVTLMWPVRYDSSLWIRTHSLSNKVSFRQISQDGVCSGSSSENRISHPPLSDPRGTGLVRLCLQPLVLPPRGCSLFFKHKRVFLTDPPWIVATWVLHNKLLQRVPECDCASNKKWKKWRCYTMSRRRGYRTPPEVHQWWRTPSSRRGSEGRRCLAEFGVSCVRK